MMKTPEPHGCRCTYRASRRVLSTTPQNRPNHRVDGARCRLYLGRLRLAPCLPKAPQPESTQSRGDFSEGAVCSRPEDETASRQAIRLPCPILRESCRCCCCERRSASLEPRHSIGAAMVPRPTVKLAKVHRPEEEGCDYSAANPRKAVLIPTARKAPTPYNVEFMGANCAALALHAENADRKTVGCGGPLDGGCGHVVDSCAHRGLRVVAVI